MTTGLFEDDELSQYESGASSPAMPTGGQQASQAALGVASGDPRYANSKLGQSLLDYGYADTARTWYTGANTGGIQNGWDNTFVEKFISGQETAGEQGTLQNYFEHKDATGVVTYDHTSKDGTKSFTFGDVFEDGQKVGNVYDQFDKDTANLMMSDWLFDGTQKARIYASSNRDVDPTAPVKLLALDEAVSAKRDENNTEIPKAITAAAFAEDVKDRQEQLREGGLGGTSLGGDEAIVAGGAAGGAAVGAGAGAGIGVWAFGVGALPGALIGGGVGALAGGVGAQLNKDALTEQAARAYEITAISTREEGTAAGIATGVSQWSGFGAKLISPMSNLTQGLYDVKAGSVGDGESEFYSVDETGERKAPTWVKVADVAATVGDSMLQFASPTGIALYTTQMTGTIAGESAELAITGGKSFDYRRGEFDNVFTDDQGNFDPLSGAAGIGKIGIDAVQLGMARGLVSKANVSRYTISETRPMHNELGGFRYTLNETGEATGRKLSLSMLAPSEQIAAVTASAMARRAAAQRGGAATADDFYRAANSLAMGEKKLRTTIVNAMGEGTEEGVQAVLEPVSHNSDIDAREVGTAAMYGFAAGAGMGLGVGARTASADERMYAQANLAKQMLTNGAESLSRSEWNAMPDVQKRTLAAMDSLNSETAKAASRRIVEDQATEQVAGTPGIHKMLDASRSFVDSQLARATDRTDGAFVITQIEDAGEVDANGQLKPGAMPSDAIASSALQLAANLNQHQRGFTLQLQQLQQDLANIDGALEDAEVQRASVQRRIDMTQLTLEWSQRINVEVDSLVQELMEDTDLAEVEADSEVLNVLLRNAFAMNIESFEGQVLNQDDKLAIARAVTMIYARDPHDSPGSYQMLVPQVSPRLTASRSDNVLEVSHAILPALRGDFDGDKLRPLNQIILDDQQFAAQRAGQNFTGAGDAVNITSPKYEKWQLRELAAAAQSTDPARQSYAIGTLVQISDTVRRRYEGRIDSRVLDQVLVAFMEAAKSGSSNARAVLLDGLANNAGQEITSFATENLSNEWLWIDQVVKSNLNWFQGVNAANRPTTQEVNTEQGAAVPQESDVRRRRVMRAATAGQTLGLETVGDSLFRKFQKLHYTAFNAGVMSALSPTERDNLMEMVELYEALGQGVTRSAVEETRSKDEITGRVMVQLEMLAADAQRVANAEGRSLTTPQALSVVANMAVLDFQTNEFGELETKGRVVSLAQMLLRQSVERDRRDKDAIFEASPELQAKHARLLAMTRPPTQGVKGSRKVNAERAFIEIVGSQQLYRLLGDASEIFGPHLTVEQYLRAYVSMDELTRRDIDRELKAQPEYLGRKSKQNLPYRFEEVNANEISAYRSVVDSLIAVGHARITVDSKGKVSGEYADRSQRVSEDFAAAHTEAREALRKSMGKRKVGDLALDQVAAFLEANPQFARSVLDLIPNASAAAVMEFRDGQVFISNWVYRMLTISDPKVAEMHLWRNLLLAELNAQGAKAVIASEDDAEVTTKYSNLPRRMHRVIVDLARQPDDGISLRRFMDQLTQADDLETFMQWINSTPGVRGRTAPLVAWVDDTAEFDADKAAGGWTTSLQGAELREAIAALRKASSRLHQDVSEETTLWAGDQQVLQSIDRALAADESGDVAATTEDRRYLAQFLKAIDLSAERYIGIGPAAMLQEIVGAARGFYPQAHTKGKNPDYVEAVGAFDALRDAIGYDTNYERVFAALTTQNLDAVGNALSQLAKDGVRTMDENGRTVEWSKPDARRMLDLLRDPETRPLARAILFPQAMERTPDGRVSQQMLHGKSLKDLLDGTTMRAMFPRVDGSLSNEAAFRYASMVDATARKFGAHSALLRAANDLVIARTSGATRVLSTGDLERMSQQAVRDVVQLLQAAAELSATNTDPDADPLGDVLDQVRAGQIQLRAGRALGLAQTDAEFSDIVFDEFLNARDMEFQEDIRSLAQRLEGEALETATTQLETSLQRAKDKIEYLRNNSAMKSAVQMFSIPADDAEAAPHKQAVVEYALAHLSMLEQSSSAKLVLSQLTTHVLDTRNATLPELDWDLLSRAVIGHFIEDAIGVAAQGVSIAPFPDAEHQSNQKYYDPTYTYLIEELLTEGSPLLQAAKELHMMAGRQGMQPDAELISTITRTVLDPKQLGPWTSDIVRLSIEANERLDSAAAANALSMFGDSPKAQGVISAATRRTFEVPGEELLSSVSLTVDHLTTAEPLRQQVQVFHGVDIPATTIPLAQLTNRFARSVEVQYVDKAGTLQTIDLLATDPNLGWQYLGNDAVANSGYRLISLARIYQALDKMVDVEVGDPSSIRVSIEFFDPSRQPAGPEWANNVFFEGTNFRLNADRYESLNAGLWFAPGGISPQGQASALDASKLGQPALKVIPVPTEDQRAAIEQNWLADFNGMLHAKTGLVLDTDMGFGKLDPEFYNTVYKNMKLRHWMRVENDGAVELWPAERVIEWQRTGGELPGNVSLWIPSDDVLRSMLGEQGTKGVTRYFDDQIEIDLGKVQTFRNDGTIVLERFDGAASEETLSLMDTSVVNRSRQSQLTVRPMANPADIERHDGRMLFFATLLDEIVEARGIVRQGNEAGRFDPARNLAFAVRDASDMLDGANLSMNWSGIAPFIGPRKPSDYYSSQLVLREKNAALSMDGFRTGWIYEEGGESRPPAGLLNQVSLSGDRTKAFSVAPGDLVVVHVDSFNGNMDLAKRRLEYLANRGAFIVLGNTDGRGDEATELGEHVLALQYDQVPGARHLYSPADLSQRWQTPRARLSTLTATRGVSTRNRVAVLNVMDLPVEENAAYVVEGNERLNGVGVTLDLVPSDFLAGFNVPVSQLSDNPQTDAVLRQLKGLDNEDGRKMLMDMSNGRLQGKARLEADTEFLRAFDAMISRLETNPGSVLPQPGDEFGTGDMIPLVDMRGRILLYRHGHIAPMRSDVDRMFTQTIEGRESGQNVATYYGEREPVATTHRGTVLEFSQRAGRGLQVEMTIPLQTYGDKKQLEWNGMKYVLTPKPSSIALPEHGIFENGWGIDLIGSMHDALSKESFDGMVDNHAAAFAYFGIDFLPDVMSFFDVTRQEAINLLHSVEQINDISVTAAHEILSSGVVTKSFMDLLPQGDTDWQTLFDQDNVQAQIATAILVYLMTPGARVENVLRSGGFNDESNTDQEKQSRLMPRLFTQFFDQQMLGSAVRTELNTRFNRQLFNPNNDGTGYVLNPDFTFEVRNADRTKNLRGFLQFAEAHSSGDNPVKNGQAFDPEGRQGVSQHSAAIAYQAIGAQTAQGRGLGRARLQSSGAGIVRFKSDTVDGGAWEMITRPARTLADSGSVWNALTPAEAERLSMGREAVTQFRQSLDTEADSWNDKQRKEYADLTRDVVLALGLRSKQRALVDYWVRQALGQPVGKDKDGNDVGKVTGKAAIEVATDMLWLVQNNYLPTVGAEVPLMHVQDLQLIYRANQAKKNGWSPRESFAKSNSNRASSWDDWVNVSLGSALLSDNLFDPMFLLALDGHMHTYTAATQSLLNLPVSMDAIIAKGALDPQVNETVNSISLVDGSGKRFLVSIDPNVDRLARDTVVLDTARATIADIVGGNRVAGKLVSTVAPASEVSKRRAARRKWRKENGVPIPVEQSMRNLRKNGEQFRTHSTNANALSRAVINLRVGTATINPALWISAGPEAFVRGTIDRAANLMTGQATVGAGAMATAKAAERLEGTLAGRALEQIGIEAVYTPDQLVRLRALYDQLGSRSEFKSMIYGSLMYLRPHEAGTGKFDRALEAYAKFGSRLQDPTYGVRAKTLARRYVEAAIQSIEATPVNNVITIDQLIPELTTNPQFLQQNYPDAHRAATNAIAQLRSLKATPLSLMLRGIYEPLSESSNSFVNTFGNLFLKVPLLFSGYAANVFTTILGLQGASDFVAMMIDGRKKGPNSIFGRMQAKMRGEEFDPARDGVIDMSSVIEGMDLTRSFIRGGLTHTSLFMFGMMAGGLGLSGEDDEAKKRRRLAEAQGAAYVYDPRSLENDFRNKDAIFLDWLPMFGGDKTMVQLNWTMKQFFSPIIGMEKFFETGDFNHVTWGFQDALGAFPLINTMMWDDAVTTANDLIKQAKAEEGKNTDAGTIASMGLLANAVGVYERMLFENAFVNQLYTSMDEWDRDPYALPLRDSDGTLQVDMQNNTRPNDFATTPYIDPETGEIREGFLGRSDNSARLHALSENRATFAFVASMFTGLGNSDYLRYNMPVKERELEKTPTSEADAETLLSGAWLGAGAMPSLTPEEAEVAVRNRLYKQTGRYYGDDVVVPIANKLSAQSGPGAMSVLNAEGREQLTSEGALMLFRGLAKGSVHLGDESLRGVYITFEQREAIQDKWMAALKQEGMDLGLDETKATSRMKRLWYGPIEDSAAVGLGDLLWSKDISYSDTVKYNQLNTTYVPGPDGFPWATGFSRGGVLTALGIAPARLPLGPGNDAMGLDGRLNSVDLVNGMNTGLRGLVLKDESANIPTDREIGKSITDAIEKAAGTPTTPFTPFSNTGGGYGYGGYGGYGGGYGYGGYGGYGGGYSGPRVYFQDMRDFNDIRTPYGNNIPFINTTNPQIRRGDVRRERVWSERGRLKQWQ